MIVWNEFRNDARVLKEAQTLQSAGYQMTVFALHTPGVTLEREVISGGIEVRRVARSPLWRLRRAREGGLCFGAGCGDGTNRAEEPHLSDFTDMRSPLDPCHSTFSDSLSACVSGACA